MPIEDKKISLEQLITNITQMGYIIKTSYDYNFQILIYRGKFTQIFGCSDLYTLYESVYLYVITRNRKDEDNDYKNKSEEDNI